MPIASLLFSRRACSGYFPGIFPIAAEPGEGWGRWWLPPNHAVHGVAVDALFTWIFWITAIVCVLVQATLIILLIRYRRRPGGKSIFIHGNRRLEMLWTLAPAVILAALSLASTRVWDNYRHAQDGPDYAAQRPATVLVIAQQFQWNFIYPGPDGKLGRYLLFPRPTDKLWPPTLVRDKQSKKATRMAPTLFAGVSGPASLPYEQAMAAINRYIDQENPLGKDTADPDGMDDMDAPPGLLEAPVNRPLEVREMSKDVIHSFTLPNYRVKLDSVPGMIGIVVFTPTAASAEYEKSSEKQSLTLDEAAAAVKASDGEWRMRLDRASALFAYAPDTRETEYSIPTPARNDPARRRTLVRESTTLTAANVDTIVSRLRAGGVERITIYQPMFWDISCQELCGQGHFKMQGRLRVLSDQRYAEKYEGRAPQ